MVAVGRGRGNLKCIFIKPLVLLLVYRSGLLITGRITNRWRLHTCPQDQVARLLTTMGLARWDHTGLSWSLMNCPSRSIRMKLSDTVILHS
jgi:hypothetical protein